MNRFDQTNQIYSKAFEEFGYSADSVLTPKAQSVRFQSVINFLPEFAGETLSLADFGCGLGHLNEFLTKNLQIPFQYTGIDINPDFLYFNKRKHSKANFVERSEFFASRAKFDVITSIGTFNLIYEENEREHKEFVYREIKELWKKTDAMLYLNFMSTVVDFKQKRAYHQDIGDLYSFVCKNMSRNIMIDSTYLPFEFSAIIWRSN